MTLQQALKDKFENKLKTPLQVKTFGEIVMQLEKHYDHAYKKAYNGQLPSFFPIEEINKVNFKENYSYWLYDRVTGLFFNNIHGLHEDFRRCLVVLNVIVNEWNEKFENNPTSLLFNKRADLEGIYTALDLGFFATGAMTMGGGSRPRVVCSENFEIYKHSFLREYQPDPIFFSKESAKTELKELLTGISKT